MEPTILLLTLSPLLPPVGAGAPACTDPVTPCLPGSNSGQLPANPDLPGQYRDAFGTPIGGCATCVGDPQMPGGPGCTFSEWTTIPPATPGTPQLQVLKFQPPESGAALVQAEITMRATLCGVLRVENRDPLNQCQAFGSLETQIDLAPAPGQGLDGLMLPALSVSDDQVFSLGAYDGTVDFGGASGTVHVSSEIIEERCLRITDPLQLAAFVDGDPGDSFLFFDHTAVDASSVIGCAPLTFLSDPYAGIEVEVSYTYCTPQELVCEGPGNVDVAIGEEIVLTWTGTGGTPLDFDITDLPPGAVVDPDPDGGPYPSPLEVTVTWNPANNQAGAYEICVTFTDGFDQTSECCASLLVSECHLIVASGPGNWVVPIGNHDYQTQVQGVRHTFALVEGHGPRFPVGPRVDMPPGTAVPVHQFVTQVVMFNPPIFPSNPEQYTNPLAVTVWSDGRVTARAYGVANNMIIRLRVHTAENGQRYFMFPFEVVNWP